MHLQLERNWNAIGTHMKGKPNTFDVYYIMRSNCFADTHYYIFTNEFISRRDICQIFFKNSITCAYLTDDDGVRIHYRQTKLYFSSFALVLMTSRNMILK